MCNLTSGFIPACENGYKRDNGIKFYYDSLSNLLRIDVRYFNDHYCDYFFDHQRYSIFEKYYKLTINSWESKIIKELAYDVLRNIDSNYRSGLMNGFQSNFDVTNIIERQIFNIAVTLNKVFGFKYEELICYLTQYYKFNESFIELKMNIYNENNGSHRVQFNYNGQNQEFWLPPHTSTFDGLLHQIEMERINNRYINGNWYE